jgi:hypothetical protein
MKWIFRRNGQSAINYNRLKMNPNFDYYKVNTAIHQQGGQSSKPNRERNNKLQCHLLAACMYTKGDAFGIHITVHTCICCHDNIINIVHYLKYIIID